MIGIAPFSDLGCVSSEAPQRGAEETFALHGGGRRLSVRAVKAAVWAFMGAERTALTEEAGGSGAEFGQEGHFGKRFVFRELTI